MRTYHVYILANHSRALYVGVTTDLHDRLLKHRDKALGGLTYRYGVTRLVYVESTENAGAALSRQKQIKRYRREKKIRLVESINPLWRDLAAAWNVK